MWLYGLQDFETIELTKGELYDSNINVLFFYS